MTHQCHWIPAACTRHWHQLFPTGRHRRYPTHQRSRTQHVPERYYHQNLLVLHHHLYKLRKRGKKRKKKRILTFSQMFDSLHSHLIYLLDYLNHLPGVTLPRAWHLTPASSAWMQLWLPMGLAGQSASLASVPPQLTLSSQIRPAPCPKKALMIAVLPWRKKENWY